MNTVWDDDFTSNAALLISGSDFVTGLAVESNGDIIVQNSGTAFTISPDGSTLQSTASSTDAASAISPSRWG